MVNPVAAWVDAYEDNDTYGTATTVIAGTYNTLYRDPSDDDWYKINLNIGDHVAFTITYTPGENLGMEMTVDNVFIYPDVSYSNTGLDTVSFTMNYTGYIYVAVGGALGPVDQGAYTMTVSVIPANAPPIGGFETMIVLITLGIVATGIIFRVKKRI